MALELWTSDELYALLTDDRNDPIPSHFLDTYFTERHFSNDKEIKLAELPLAGRQMAPFVLPTEQGKPIFGAKPEKVKAYLPPYLKPKDAVRPADARTPRPSELLRQTPLTLQERFDARTAEVQAFHRRAILMQETYMAAQGFVTGKVSIKYDRDQGAAFPEVVLDFGRDAGHTIVKSTGFWSDPEYPILDDIQAWGNTMRRAVRGGFPARIYLGSAVAEVFNKNKQVIAEMDTTRRGTQVSIQTGIINTAQPLTFLGTVGAGIEVYVYADHVEDAAGNPIELLDPKTVLLVAPGATGARAYGAIYDAEAMMEGQSAQVDIYPKMFPTKDPGEIFIMHQSSPLPIPLYPNRTLWAKVLA